MGKRKYTTYAELAAAFKAGDLDGWQVWMDNDCSGMQWIGDGEEPVDGDTLFRGAGPADIDDALDALGIPWDYV